MLYFNSLNSNLLYFNLLYATLLCFTTLFYSIASISFSLTLTLTLTLSQYFLHSLFLFSRCFALSSFVQVILYVLLAGFLPFEENTMVKRIFRTLLYYRVFLRYCTIFLYYLDNFTFFILFYLFVCFYMVNQIMILILF